VFARVDCCCHRWETHVLEGRHERPTGLPPNVAATVKVGGEAWALDAGGGAVWAQVGDLGAVRIDPATNRITARIGDVANVEFVGDELWGAALDRLLLLDPATGRTISSIALPTTKAFRVVGGAGALWVPTDDMVLRVERSGPVSEIPIDCPEAREAAFGFDSLWLACKGSGVVLRVDAATRRVLATIETGPGPHHVVVGEDAVWVANFEANAVSRIEPSSNAVVATIRGGGRGVGLTMGNGVLWAALQNAVVKIDPQTNRIIGRVPLPYASMYYGLVLAEGSLWAAARNRQLVYRVKI